MRWFPCRKRYSRLQIQSVPSKAYPLARVVRGIALAVVVVLTVVGSLLCPTTAMAGSIDSGAPVVDKSFAKNPDGTLQVDGDGNYTLQLSVTGKSTSTTTTTKANVIFVADVSGSMTEQYGSTSRLDAAKSSIVSAGATILGQDGARVKLITFSTKVVTDYGWTSDVSEFDGNVSSMSAGGGTSWEAALAQAETDAKSAGDGDTYIIFVSDGDPTFRMTQVYSDEEYAEHTRTDLWGRDVYSDAVSYRDDKWYLHSDGVYGSGYDDPKGWDFTAANTVASRLIGDDGYMLFTINVSDSAKMNGLAATQHYAANDPATMQSALSSIVKQITDAYSYKDVVMTDTVTTGDMVVGTGAGGGVDGFSYTTTDAGGTPTTWVDAPAATYDSGKKTVTWDLGTMSLEDGKTYTVSFKVKLTQQAYDDAARLASGQQPTSSNIERNGDGSVTAYANSPTGNTVAYTQFMTENGIEEAGSEKNGTVDFPRPGLDVPLSTLTLTKCWDGDGTKPGSVSVHIHDDSGEFTQDVTLAGDGWAQTIYVPAGPEGHVWQVTETSQSEGWVLEGYEATGLVANGTVDAEGTLQGLAAQSASVTITNKQVEYEFRILKAGSDGTILKGATFEVSGRDSQTTGDDGLATFGSLTPGTYAVTEDQVPAGYTLPGTHTLVIRNDGTATWDGSEITNTGDDQGTKYFQVTVTNDKIASLPMTGGVGVVPFAAVGAVLIVIGVARPFGGDRRSRR